MEDVLMFHYNFIIHRLIFQCAPLHQCQGYQNTALNMQESYSGPKKSHLEVNSGARLSFFISVHVSIYFWCTWLQEHLSSSHLDTSLDGDNPEHIQWVFERAQERALEFSITGVTYRLTQGEPVSFCYANEIHLWASCSVTALYHGIL